MTDLTEIKTYNDMARQVLKTALLNALADPATLDRLVDAFVVHPCHVTGQHDPSHTTKYLCDIQQTSIAKAVVAALGLPTIDISLPHALHRDCLWCHYIPTQEEYRRSLRDLHEWAGVPISPELAEPANDASRPGDVDIIWKSIVNVWIDSEGGVFDEFSYVLIHPTHDAEGRRWDPMRTRRAYDTLKEQGLVESGKPTYIRLTAKGVAVVNGEEE